MRRIGKGTSFKGTGKYGYSFSKGKSHCGVFVQRGVFSLRRRHKRVKPVCKKAVDAKSLIRGKVLAYIWPSYKQLVLVAPLVSTRGFFCAACPTCLYRALEPKSRKRRNVNRKMTFTSLKNVERVRTQPHPIDGHAYVWNRETRKSPY